MVRIARTPDLFSYLRDCKGNFEVQVGDGRLSLEKQPERRYGLIALDAFSSDAIPIHLLTREAIEMYVRQAAPGRGARLPRVEQVPGPGARARQRGARAHGLELLRPGRQDREPRAG